MTKKHFIALAHALARGFAGSPSITQDDRDFIIDAVAQELRNVNSKFDVMKFHNAVNAYGLCAVCESGTRNCYEHGKIAN